MGGNGIEKDIPAHLYSRRSGVVFLELIGLEKIWDSLGLDLDLVSSRTERISLVLVSGLIVLSYKLIFDSTYVSNTHVTAIENRDQISDFSPPCKV